MTVDFHDRVRAAAIGRDLFFLGARYRTILIVPADFEPRLPACAGYIGDDLVFMSACIPKEYRAAVAVHEVCCVPKIGTPGHCADALHAELEWIHPNERLQYLEFRKCFFDRLLELFARKPPPYYEEMLRARAHLDEMRVNGKLFSIPYIG